MVNRDNYNIDSRLFRKEKLRSGRWLLWSATGLVICLLPVLIDGKYATLSIGLVISWLCLLFAAAGIIRADANQAALKKFAERHQLTYSPRLADTHPDGRAVNDSVLGAQLAAVLDASKMKAVRFDNVLASPKNSQLQLTICRLSFEYSGQLEKRLYQYSLIMCTTMHNDFPAFAIDGGQVYDFARFVALDKKTALSLEGSFGNEHTVYVTAENRTDMLSFFSPDVMELHQTHFGQSSLVSHNGRLAILTREDIYADDAYVNIYEGLQKLRGKLERYNRLHRS
jgi:hypothetical protein